MKQVIISKPEMEDIKILLKAYLKEKHTTSKKRIETINRIIDHFDELETYYGWNDDDQLIVNINNNQASEIRIAIGTYLEAYGYKNNEDLYYLWNKYWEIECK